MFSDVKIICDWTIWEYWNILFEYIFRLFKPRFKDLPEFAQANLETFEKLVYSNFTRLVKWPNRLG